VEFKRFPAKNIEKKKYFYKKEKHLWKKVFLYGVLYEYWLTMCGGEHN